MINAQTLWGDAYHLNTYAKLQLIVVASLTFFTISPTYRILGTIRYITVITIMIDCKAIRLK